MKLESKLDNSINYVEEQLVGFIESRYVRRTDDYFIGYLSSQTGCNRGCKFCHLTTTKQTKFENETASGFNLQIIKILKEYSEHNPAKTVHWNFMARGEPLMNEVVNSELLYTIGRYSHNFDLIPKFNVSTIIPRDVNFELSERFDIVTPTIYYSIYSVNPDFRKKWIPNGMDVDDALRLLKEYQKMSKKIIKFHSAFIAGENDSANDISEMMERIESHKIVGEFNLVRYNPFSENQGKESDYLYSIQTEINRYMPCKIITRVGEDVHASCGQFYQDK